MFEQTIYCQSNAPWQRESARVSIDTEKSGVLLWVEQTTAGV